MAKAKYAKAASAALALATLVGCGGGGTGNPANLSSLQKNFESASLLDAWVSYDWNLPSNNVTPLTGVHFVLQDQWSITSPVGSGQQTANMATRNLAATLALPLLTQRDVSRVVRNAAIFMSNHNSKRSWRYAGAQVQQDRYADDGATIVSSRVFDNWSSPVALSGPMSASSVLKSFVPFSQTNAPSNFNFSQAWLPGATYSTQKSYQLNDTLTLIDWSVDTYDTNVSAFSGPATTLEGLFASFSGSGGLIVDNVTYPITAGSISVVAGARTWVANVKRPGSASPTAAFVAFVELNGKLYLGSLVRAGTRTQNIDGLDPSITNDYEVRFNAKAADSVRQAIKF